MIYFVWDSGSNFVKIGVSDDPEARLDGLQTGNPNPLFILATMPGGEDVEAGLHVQFASLRHGGEWFRPNPEFMWFIHSIASKGRFDPEDTQPWRRKASMSAVAWLEARFREKREWESNDLKRLAAECGISKNALWSSEALALPIAKKRRANGDGDCVYVWIAQEEWPLATENSNGPRE